MANINIIPNNKVLLDMATMTKIIKPFTGTTGEDAGIGCATSKQ